MSAATSPWVFDVTEADFEQKVLQRSHQTPVVVDFWSSRCRPCMMLKPILERLVDERGGEVLLAKVNTDENPRLALAFRIEALPSVIAFRNGQPVLDFIGLLPEPQLRQFLDQVVPGVGEKLAQQAAALEKTDPARAEALYRQALKEDDRLAPASLGLARLLLQQNKDEEARNLLANVVVGGEMAEELNRLQALLDLRHLVPAGADEAALRRQIEQAPKKAQPRYELGCLLAGRGQYAEALEMLLSAGERDSSLASTKVREAMVKVFHLVGANSPLANEYREKLAGLLY